MRTESEIRDLSRECVFALEYIVAMPDPITIAFMRGFLAALQWTTGGTTHDERIRAFLDACQRERLAEGRL